MAAPNLFIGTQSFTAEGWERAFYPPKLPKNAWLTYYSSQFPCVEIDATFYAVPRRSTVESWRDKTPDDFQFAVKMFSDITHKKQMLGADPDLDSFLDPVSLLGHKLSAILIQLPYYNKKAFAGFDAFSERLDGFLSKLPMDFRYALEVRNKNYLQPGLFQILRNRNIAYTLQDHVYMPRPSAVISKFDVHTSDFVYCRLIGDRESMEEETQFFDREVIPREKELEEWANLLVMLSGRASKIFAFINNHFSGYAPATIAKLRKLLEEKTKKEKPQNAS